MRIHQVIENTLILPNVTIQQIETICTEALQYNFKSVCIPPLFIKLCKEILKESSVTVSTVIGYPFGYSAVEAKLAEILLSIVDGVDDVEVMINYTAIKNKDWKYVSNEFIHLLQVVESSNKPLTIILETGHLSNDEIVQCCRLYGAANIKAIKTGTGLFSNEALTNNIVLMRKNLSSDIGIKAYGQINDISQAIQLLEAGATSIGTQYGSTIMKEYQKLNNYN